MDLSEDHKPTDVAELSRIQRAGGCVGTDERVNGGLNLSRAIGRSLLFCHIISSCHPPILGSIMLAKGLISSLYSPHSFTYSV